MTSGLIGRYSLDAMFSTTCSCRMYLRNGVTSFLGDVLQWRRWLDVGATCGSGDVCRDENDLKVSNAQQPVTYRILA